MTGKKLAATDVTAAKPVVKKSNRKVSVAKAESAGAAKKTAAPKIAAVKKVAAAVPAKKTTKAASEVSHGRKNAKATSKAAPATVQPSPSGATKGKAVARAAAPTAKKPVAKAKTTK